MDSRVAMWIGVAVVIALAVVAIVPIFVSGT